MFKLLLIGILSITCIASTVAVESPTGDLAEYAKQIQSMTHEQLMEEMMKNMGEMATILGTVKDVNSAKLAKAKLKQVGKKMGILQKTGETLDSSLSEAQIEAMEEKYAPEGQAITRKMMSAMMGLVANPAVMEELGDLSAIMSGRDASPQPNRP